MEKLLKVKSLSTLKNDLTKIFNEFIRLRDTQIGQGTKFFICISCNLPKGLDQMHAGHFLSAGEHESIRWDEHNVNGQCMYCNYYKHGSPVKYRANLVRKIGAKAVEALELKCHNRSKMNRFEVELLIQQYTEKVKQLKR